MSCWGPVQLVQQLWPTAWHFSRGLSLALLCDLAEACCECSRERCSLQPARPKAWPLVQVEMKGGLPAQWSIAPQ